MSKAVYTVELNGERIELDMPEVSGAQVRALFAVENTWAIVVEGTGSMPDRLVGDEDVVSLREGPIRLFTSPPTMFGGVSYSC